MESGMTFAEYDAVLAAIVTVNKGIDMLTTILETKEYRDMVEYGEFPTILHSFPYLRLKERTDD
jgi:hypothetical protein